MLTRRLWKGIFVMLLSLCVVAQDDDFLLKDNLDVFPENVGGKTELQRFFEQQVVYPDKALKEKKEGTVRIKCVITEQGKALKPTVVGSAGAELDNEALRLFRLLEWVPGEKDGKKVNTYHFVSFTFDISKYKKYTRQRGFAKPKPDKKFPADTSNAVFEHPEQMADYQKGSDKGLAEYIQTTLEYPNIAKVQNIEGDVLLSFIVEKNGRVSNITILKGVSGGCNEEAISLMGETRWKPAVHKGKTVRSRYKYSIRFSLQNVYKGNEMGEQK
jgi:TonB family protein